MRTRLFLRTAEFLWQEGHTCHASAAESSQMAKKMLEEYKSFAEEFLALPVWAGKKSESEKFPGALATYAIEAMMQDLKALQAGTSHDLSTNFASVFGTKFLDRDGREKWVHQSSWGVSTRLIGGVIMTHSDDRGLVLPPKLAETHVVVVPILGKAAKDLALKEKLYQAAQHLGEQIRSEAASGKLGYEVGVFVDQDETKKPGWKFHEYEVTGIPIRVELGPNDLEKNVGIWTRRDLSLIHI